MQVLCGYIVSLHISRSHRQQIRQTLALHFVQRASIYAKCALERTKVCKLVCRRSGAAAE
eukprot:scaffold280634_cov46-Prasinocladus_malaysianus.AAC.1